MVIVESRLNIINLLNLPTAYTTIIHFWWHDVDCLLRFQLYINQYDTYICDYMKQCIEKLNIGVILDIIKLLPRCRICTL